MSFGKTVLITATALGLTMATTEVKANAWSLSSSVMGIGAHGFGPIDVSGSEIQEEQAVTFINRVGEKAISILETHSSDQNQRSAGFEALLNENFDVKTIGRVVLGRYWRAASAEQQDEYMELFKDMIVRVYTERLNEYSGQKFQVTNAYSLDGKDSMVQSYIVPKSGPKVRLDWRVRPAGDTFKIVDVIVEGVSMSQTQRSEFASIINRNGGNVDALLAYLR